MPEVQQSPLPPDTAARLTAFARACKGAARVVSLYPPEHPAIGEALQRLMRVVAGATESGPLSILVLPDNLLVGGRTAARADTAIAELASLLHTRMVGEITIQPDVEPVAWRTLLGLLGLDPEDVRARGGLARALTTAGGIGIEITELDYSGIIEDRASGSEATWTTILAYCLQTDALDLDEKTLRILGEIASDPTRLADLFERTEGQPGKLSTRDRTVALLRALRGVSSFFGREDPGKLDGVFDNMAAAVPRLSPDFVMEMVGIGLEPGSEDASLVTEITQRITDPAIAQFVARTVANQRACTSRLMDAFRALAPDHRRQKAVATLAHQELARSPIGEEPGFERLWSQVEDLLLSHSDKSFVSNSYSQELASAHDRASGLEHILDDPPERIIGWLKTVSDVSIRALDLQLLADLLVVESDRSRRQELLQLLVSQIDELVVLGDFDGARRLAEAMAGVAIRPEAAEARTQVLNAIEQLVAGEFMSQVTVHLNAVRDEEFEHVKGLCAAVGPTLVPKLAETLSAETRARARQRLTELLIGFGKHGRHSVDQLLQSPSASVRRTAVQLLRSFGGPEALPDLERLVNDTEPGVQRDAARALIGLGIDESFEMLKRILVTEKHRGREALIEELGSTRDQKATPLFCHLVRHIECRGQLREIYLRSLGRLGLLGGPEAVEALSDALRKGRWWAPLRTREIRTEAAAALSQIKLPAARDALCDAATNGSFGVRSIAKKHVKTA
jgi:hypothetical protein